MDKKERSGMLIPVFFRKSKPPAWRDLGIEEAECPCCRDTRQEEEKPFPTLRISVKIILFFV